MKVGIEGSLFFKRSSGVGLYAKELTKAAVALSQDVDFEIVRHVLPLNSPALPIAPSNHLHYRLVRWFPPVVYYQSFKRLGWFLPYDLFAARRYDAFLFFNFIAFPLRKHTKSIIVVHDLSFVHFPQYIQAKNLIYLKKFLPASIERAGHIIAVSDSTKKDIIQTYGVPNQKVSVIPNAVDHAHFYQRSSGEAEKVIKKYQLPKKYIHFHGTIEPRKNIVGLLDAYASLSAELTDEYGLVLTGGKGWKDEAIYKKVDELKAQNLNIVLPGYIDGDDLPAIYSGASLFVWPSFYEGFGIPPLEAMACGTPVITSNNSSLPEVVGDAAIMIKAEDNAAITKAMAKVLNNPKLAGELGAKGLAQSKKFSWDKSGQLLLDLLKGLA